MKDYITLSKFTKIGDMNIARNVFSQIGENTINLINENEEKKGFKISGFSFVIKDNKVFYNLKVDTKEVGTEWDKIKEEIYENFKEALMTICEGLLFNINIEKATEK